MSKIPKPLIDAVEEALTGAKVARTVARDAKPLRGVLPAVTAKPSRIKVGGATNMESVRQSLPEQIAPKKRVTLPIQLPETLPSGMEVVVSPSGKKKIVRSEQRTPAPEGMRYETIMYKGEPTTVLVEDMDFAPPVVNTQVKPTNAKEAIYSFRDQYYKNPLNPREVIVGNALVELMNTGDNAIHLNSIRTLQPNSGEASKALKVVTDMADANGIPLYLYANPYGTGGLNKKQLIAWYKRNGFIDTGDGYMTRDPKQPK